MAAGSEATARPFWPWVVAIAVAGFGWLCPLFHVVPLATPHPGGPAIGATNFDPRAAAEKLWSGDVRAAALHAADVTAVVGAVRDNPETAKSKFAKSAGLGTAYFFVRGSGKIVAQEKNFLRVAVTAGEEVALRTGAVFGNTVRDGCGVADVNAYPGLEEFNALSAELNSLVEKNVLPTLRTKAAVGAVVTFAGCAEAPETVEAGEPVLTIVPVQAEVR